MLYSAYEMAYVAVAPARIAAGLGARFWRSPFNPVADSWMARSAAAALDVFENVMRRYPKPKWNISSTIVNGIDVPLTIEEADRKNFCTLLHFKKDHSALLKARGSNTPEPRVLIIAPLSGHYATLLRGTVEAMLPGHDVYITDWTDARNVPVALGLTLAFLASGRNYAHPLLGADNSISRVDLSQEKLRSYFRTLQRPVLVSNLPDFFRTTRKTLAKCGVDWLVAEAGIPSARVRTCRSG